MTGTATISAEYLSQDRISRALVIEWTADASGNFSFDTDSESVIISGPAGPFSVPISEWIRGCYLLVVETAPGSPAPTANYGATFHDAYGYDLFKGAVVNQPASGASVPNVQTNLPCRGKMTLAMNNNSVANAQGTLILFMVSSANMPGVV